MTEVQIRLGRVYPSLNKILRMNRWRRTEAKNKFMTDCAVEIAALNPYRFHGSVEVEIDLHMGPGRLIGAMDSDNFTPKWLLDVLVRKGIIRDDKTEIIPETPRVRFHRTEKGEREHTLVTIRDRTGG